MILKERLYDERRPWRNEAYYVAARYRELELAGLTSGLVARWVEVEVGGRLLPHARSSVVLYVGLEGVARLTVGEEETTLGPGELVAVPPGRARGLRNEGAATVRLLLIEPPTGSPWRLVASRLRGVLRS